MAVTALGILGILMSNLELGYQQGFLTVYFQLQYVLF
jgi:hypothetical protein